MRYIIAILLMLVPLHVAADQNEDALQHILDDHLAFCVSEQGQFNNVEAQEAELEPIQLKLSDDSIYQFNIQQGSCHSEKSTAVLKTISYLGFVRGYQRGRIHLSIFWRVPHPLMPLTLAQRSKLLKAQVRPKRTEVAQKLTALI